MKPTPVLIEALRGAAYLIKTFPEHYNWSNPTVCNCGILAQVLGVTPTDMGGIHAWSRGGQEWQHCMTTGLPLHHVYATLRKAGLTPSDLERIEFLDMTTVEEWKNIPDSPDNLEWAKPANVIEWFLKQADFLESQLVSQETAARVEEVSSTRVLVKA